MIAIMAQTDSTHLTLADDQTPPQASLKLSNMGDMPALFKDLLGGKFFCLPATQIDTLRVEHHRRQEAKDKCVNFFFASLKLPI